MLDPLPSHLHGLVDMGSNGIRFSITDLRPETARSLPTVFQDRAGISLFDAQYSTGEKGPIPQNVIGEVLAALLRFKATCVDFQVPETNIRILATEATRTAINSEDYRKQIRDATGWEVDMVPKEVEGRIGAMGIASSFSTVEGLVMDLGGGSTQITWMVAANGDVQTSPKGSYSFPYGAAALSRQLSQIDSTSNPAEERHKLAEAMRANFKQAYTNLELPETLLARAKSGGLTLYLSGGGFRGWGYLLMSQHKVSPYPIPIINGFQVRKRDFQDTENIEALASEEDVFRVSQRRAGQVPAVAFLVNILVDALPVINNIRFCQGGVREGFLYDTLDKATRAMDPLPAISSTFAGPSAAEIADLLHSALPGENDLGRFVSPSFAKPVIRGLADMLYAHSALPKESASLAALYAPITGLLASAHGVSHTDRALLALCLCQRWEGELPPPHDDMQARLRAILTPQEVFWCNYMGTVAKLVGDVYPAGRIIRPRLKFQCAWENGLGKKGLEQGIHLVMHARENDVTTAQDVTRDAVAKIEGVGKRKNRVGGRDGFGIRIEVSIERDLI